MTEPEWRRANRANWDERVSLHLKARCITTRPLCGLAMGGLIKSN